MADQSQSMPTSHDPPHLFDLSGRVAVVTGGSRGLGREMAFAFARFGADVVIASRKQESCEETAKEIRDATGRRAIGCGCHVGKWKDLGEPAERGYGQLG